MEYKQGIHAQQPLAGVLGLPLSAASARIVDELMRHLTNTNDKRVVASLSLASRLDGQTAKFHKWRRQ